MLFDLSDVETLKVLATGFGGGMTGLLALLSVKRRIAAFFERWAAARRRKRVDRVADTQEKAGWYAHAYYRIFRAKDVDMSVESFHNLSVQQACAIMCEPLPHWAHGGWERTRLSWFNTPAWR